jgi:plasmid maintenance system killer protein
MIKSFRHKGLKLLFEEDDGKKLPADMLLRIRIIFSFEGGNAFNVDFVDYH